MSSLSEAPINAPYSLWIWNDMRVHFARQGDGPALLLVHSLNGGASAYEMRKVFVELSKHFEVFAPDLPGFGASERRRMDYTAEGYIQFLKDFHSEHIGRPCCVVASSISAAYVIQVAHDEPKMFAKLALVVPTGICALAGKRRSVVQRAARALLFSPVGTGIFQLLSTRRAIRYFMTTQGFHDPRAFTNDYAEHLYRTMRKPNAKYGPTAFLTGAAHWNIADVFGKLQQPTLIVWGQNAETTPLSQARNFIVRKPDAQLEIFDRCSLLAHDEHSEMFNALIQHFFKEGELGK